MEVCAKRAGEQEVRHPTARMAGFSATRRVATWVRMRSLSPVMIAVLLGAAMSSLAAPYDLAAETAVINASPAHEVIKADARQTVMFEALDQPAMAPGTALVLPRDGRTPIVLARRSA